MTTAVKNSGDKNYTLADALEDATIIVDGAALGALRSADLERASADARSNPRQMTRFREDLTTLATSDQEVAESCYYSLPRGGRPVQGPSVRFAEMVAYAWTNLDTSTTIMGVDEHAAVVRARVVDLERNTVHEMESRRPVYKKRNKPRPDEDDKQIAVAVATSIAYRNAVFRAVPRALWEPVYRKTLDAADGHHTMDARRKQALKMFADMGKTEAQVLAALSHSTVDEITATDLRHLKGLVQSIRDGLISVDDAIRPPEPERPRGATTTPSKLGAKIKAKAAAEHAEVAEQSVVETQAEPPVEAEG